MERKTAPVWTNAMNYGLIGGLALSLFRFLTSLGNATFDGISILRWPILIGIIVYGTLHLRKHTFDDVIKYGLALYSGMLISLFSGVIYGFYVFLEFAFLFPHLMEEFLILQEEALMKMPFFDGVQLEQMIEQLRENQSPLRYGFSEIFTTAFWGAIFSLVIAIFLKKENPYNGEVIEN